VLPPVGDAGPTFGPASRMAHTLMVSRDRIPEHVRAAFDAETATSGDVIAMGLEVWSAGDYGQTRTGGSGHAVQPLPPFG
jgi:hypothetical protein